MAVVVYGLGASPIALGILNMPLAEAKQHFLDLTAAHATPEKIVDTDVACRIRFSYNDDTYAILSAVGEVGDIHSDPPSMYVLQVLPDVPYVHLGPYFD